MRTFRIPAFPRQTTLQLWIGVIVLSLTSGSRASAPLLMHDPLRPTAIQKVDVSTPVQLRVGKRIADRSLDTPSLFENASLSVEPLKAVSTSPTPKTVFISFLFAVQEDHLRSPPQFV